MYIYLLKVHLYNLQKHDFLQRHLFIIIAEDTAAAYYQHYQKQEFQRPEAYERNQ